MKSKTIENHAGRFIGLDTNTQKRIHNAKVFRITPNFIKITDRNDGQTYKYKRSSIIDIRF